MMVIGVVIVIAVILIFVAIVLGKNNSTPEPSSCSYYGKIYEDGARFPAGDGCNSCGCDDGNVACTEIACNVPEIEGSEGTDIMPQE